MLKNAPQARYRSRGLSLVELMVALVAGLIVSGAAVALIVAIMKSNANTIRATRLTQELRTTAEVIARDLRRARSVSDPVGNIGTTPLLNACNTISPASGSSASCVTFGYDCNSATSGTFKAIGLVGGKVRIVKSLSAVPTCPTATTGTQLSSNIITLIKPDGTDGLKITAVGADQYRITLTGRSSDDNNASPLYRSITQEVRIRSAAVN